MVWDLGQGAQARGHEGWRWVGSVCVNTKQEKTKSEVHVHFNSLLPSKVTVI